MIAGALQNLEALFSWVVMASWQASVLAALVLLLQWMLGARLNPRWRYALWLLVVVRLVLPALPESALSLFQFTPPPPPAFVVPVTGPLFVSDPLPASTTVNLPSVEPTAPLSAYSLLAITWLSGAVILLFLTWQVNRRFARQIARSPPVANPELLQLLAAAKNELGISRSIRLIENSQVQSPAIMGLFQPTLLLPADVRSKFDARELRFIFLHELAHLKRGDVAVQALIALLQIIHWFNPVLWLAFRRMRIDREPATDALVLSRTGEDEKERYGLMLIKLLEHFNQRHSLPTLVGILEDKDQFKRRFSLIARFTCGAYGWSLLGALLLGILAVACLTKSKVTRTTDQSSPEPQNSFCRVEVLAIELPESDYQENRVQIDDAVRQGHNLMLEKLPNARVLTRGYLPVTKFGHGSGLGTPPNNPSLMIRCTPALEQGKVTLTGDLTVNHVQRTERPGNVALVEMTPVGSFPLSGTLVPAPAQFQAIPEEGIPGPVAALDLGKQKPYRLFLLFKAWPQVAGRALATKQPGKPALDQALLTAVRKGDAATLQKLIAQGGDPKTFTGNQRTLLFDAGSPEVAEILIAGGVDPKVRDSFNLTALSAVCFNGGKNTADIARVLLEHGADPNSRDGQLKTTPIMGVQNGSTVDVLVQFGADWKALDNQGNDALFWSTWHDVSAFEALLRHGAPFDAQKDGPTLLLHATWNGNLPLVTWLSIHGVDPNTPGVWNRTNGHLTMMLPICASAISGQPAAAKLLLEHGAKGEKAMALALQNHYNDIVKLLWEHGARNISELCYAISQHAPLSDLEKILKKGGPVDPPQDTVVTPLGEAAATDNFPAVQLLVQHSADVNKGGNPVAEHPEYHDTPLALAAERGQTEVVAFLLQHGAKADPIAVSGAANAGIPNSFYAGKDHLPNQEHYEQVIQMLINAGALKSVNPDWAGRLLGQALSPCWGAPDPVVVQKFLAAGLSPEVPAPNLVENGEAPNSIIGHYRDYYEKHKDHPPYGRTEAEMKALLNLLEAAGKNSAGTGGDSNQQAVAAGQPPPIVPSLASIRQIQIEAKVMEIPIDVYQKHEKTIRDAVEKGDFAALSRIKGISILASPSVTTRTDQKATIELVREFAYPIKFDNPKNISGPVSGSPPVGHIPAIPIDFAIRDIGISTDVTPSLDEGDSPTHGKILLNGKFSVTDFAGMTESNIGPKLPSFDTRETNFLEALDEGQSKSIWIPNPRYSGQLVEDRPVTGKTITLQNIVKVQTVFFFTARLVGGP